MLAKRIIPCLDVKNGQVIKGVQFRNHEVVGDILDLAMRYRDEGADELVFYDITASSENRTIDRSWVKACAKILDIPFTVAGGIKTINDAKDTLANGADKISINSPALENPDIINKMSEEFGKQCIVIGIDSHEKDGNYYVHQYTGDEARTKNTNRNTIDWVKEVIKRGAGEIVLNCMNQDGVKNGYDISQLKAVRDISDIPVIASGGAGNIQHFIDVFKKANVDGALAASVFHKKIIAIKELKETLKNNSIHVRL